jgi:acetylglutamate kinase
LDQALLSDITAAGVVPVVPSLAVEDPSPPTPLPSGERGETRVPLPSGERGEGPAPLAPRGRGVGGEGWLNVNADTAAAAVAANLKAEKLVLLTDTPGILLDRTDSESLARSLDAQGCRDLIVRGVIDEGMIPKVEACLDSLHAGVRKTHIIDGRLRHSLLLEIYTDKGVGTEIVLGP